MMSNSFSCRRIANLGTTGFYLPKPQTFGIEITMSEHPQDDVGKSEAQTQQNEVQAKAIKQTSAAAVLATCLRKTYGKVVGSNGFKAYVEANLAEAGNPKDPIERMMVEQLVIAHHRIGDLHAEAACAENPEVAALYQATAARLMNEFRKTSLALREYRTPVTSPKLTLVGQQNVAAGNQQIAYVNGQEQKENKSLRSEQRSKEPKAITHEEPIQLDTQPSTSRRRQAEPLEVERTDSRGPAAFAGSRIEPQALDAIHRSENSGG